ncbi:MAG: hypothetical protein ABIQ47_13195 [Tepidiformaceae bacterium]
MPTRSGSLKVREFVFFCEDQALAGLPEGFRKLERKVMWTILQLNYGEPQNHFEINTSLGRRQIELGVHFEGRVEQNDIWAFRLSERACELMAALGPGWELEEWTASWRRLHRVFKFTKLTTDLGREVGAELCKALQVLGPILYEGSHTPVAASSSR